MPCDVQRPRTTERVMPSVDVVIPNYQYGRFLKECVESVLTQGVRDVRVFIIDNASTDNSCEVARSLLAQDSRIRLIEHRVNLGHTASFNEGIDLATADYFMILCADDLLTPGCLARAISAMETYPALSFVYGEGAVSKADEHIAATAHGYAPAGWKITQSDRYIEECCRTPMRSAGFTLIRTSVQKQAGHYKPELPFGDDVEMLLRLARLGPVAETDAIQGIWRVHDSNRSMPLWANSTRRQRAAEAVFESFFSGEGRPIDGVARLRRIVRRKLGNHAYWSAVSQLIHGRLGEAMSLFGLAFSRAPLTALVPPVNDLLRRSGSFVRIRKVAWKAVRRSP